MSNDYQPFDFGRAQAETIVYRYRARGDTTFPRRWIPETAEQEPCLSVPKFHQLILSPTLFTHGYREQHRRHLSLSAAPGTQTRCSHLSAAPSTPLMIPSPPMSQSYHTPPPSPQISLYSLPVGRTGICSCVTTKVATIQVKYRTPTQEHVWRVFTKTMTTEKKVHLTDNGLTPIVD